MAQTVKVWLDKNFIQGTKGSGELLTTFEKANLQTIIENLPLENSIFWTRVAKNNDNKSKANKLIEEEEIQHDHILVKLELDKFIEYLRDFIENDTNTNENSNSLVSYVRHVKAKAQVTYVTLLIQGFRKYMKELKTTSRIEPEQQTSSLIKKSSKKGAALSDKKIPKNKVNMLMIDLELNEDVCIRSYETNEELRDLVLAYTKSVSEYVMKQQDANNLICEQKGEKSSHQVKLGGSNGKEYTGLINVWKDMLECFPLVSSDQAQAIVTKFPSPLLLKQAYTSTSNKLLLADIQVRRGAGVLTSLRRIGPELSQKIYKFITSKNMNELLVN